LSVATNKATKRKTSIDNDGNRSLGRSSNGGRNGSNERVLKLKISKSKGTDKNPFQQPNPDPKNQKIIATIQRMRQGHVSNQTKIQNTG
jgi:hypothetical protein